MEAARNAAVIKITISVKAFEAVARTLPLGSVAVEAEANERSEKLVWLEAPMVDRLGAMRRTGESYSEVILRLAGMEGARAR